MGRPSGEPQDLEAADTHELLPLYSETDQASSSQELELPAREATPAQVREYLFSLLHRRGIDPDHARPVSAKWVLGSGTELREYTRDMYIGIFGAEDGWILHRDVQAKVAIEKAKIAEEQKWAKKRKSYTEKLASAWSMGSTSLIGLALLGGGIPMAVVGSGAILVWGVFMIIFGFFITLSMVFIFGEGAEEHMSLKKHDAELRAERESSE